VTEKPAFIGASRALDELSRLFQFRLAVQQRGSCPRCKGLLCTRLLANTLPDHGLKDTASSPPPLRLMSRGTFPDSS